MSNSNRVILAFLQNQWFRNPARIQQIINDTTARETDRTPESIREWYIKTFLFFGCLTGRRLKKHLGEELCDLIIWEETSKEIGNTASSCFAPDYSHICEVINRHHPAIILMFGRIASNALLCVNYDCIKLACCHPAARGAYVCSELDILGDKLRELLGYFAGWRDGSDSLPSLLHTQRVAFACGTITGLVVGMALGMILGGLIGP